MNGLLSPLLARMRIGTVRPFLRGRVLDYGCGRGRLCDLVPAGQFVGLDADAAALAEARRLHPGHVFQTVEALGEGSGFDTIIAMAVIGYIPDLEGLFASFAERLNQGGRIVVTSPTPQANALHRIGARLGVFGSDTYQSAAALPDRPRIEQAARSAGLRLVHYGRFMLGLNQIAVFEARAPDGKDGP